MPKTSQSKKAKGKAVKSDLPKRSSGKKFQLQWYDEYPEWRNWVRPIKNDNLFYCRACKKPFSCSKSNIECHEKTKVHAKAFSLLKFDEARILSQTASGKFLTRSGSTVEVEDYSVLNMADRKPEEIVTECSPEKKVKSELEKCENDVSVHKSAISLSNFQMKRLLNVNSARKQVFVEGNFAGHDSSAIVILEKKSFPVEEIFLNRGFFNEGTIIRKNYRNGIYGNYECFPTREYNGINATVIHPASQSHLDKYSVKELHLVEETYETYKNITLPHIESQQFSLEWVDNILAHRAEADRIIYEDKNKETGFLMLPDLKWDGNPESLTVLALAIKRIKSIRELNASHLPLLKNIQKAGIETILKKYNVPASRLRIYLHYRPSYYHLHVHFTYLMFESQGTFVEKAHLLSTVIQNIELMPDYYQKASLSFAVAENDPLYKKYQEHGLLPSETSSSAETS
ncbi:m7GpppX diphosphatase [Belonocnema kinseyi]|uniref:m7GpppX diphosphatase n=1 Tax=Belonocnema kinseyi TaxID=2817044 RepID=UPI00143CC638|nr:m7GpppX diphosphatase [Belonocnema kinseyi]